MLPVARPGGRAGCGRRSCQKEVDALFNVAAPWLVGIDICRGDVHKSAQVLHLLRQLCHVTGCLQPESSPLVACYIFLSKYIYNSTLCIWQGSATVPQSKAHLADSVALTS